jgi:hypothetical protein
MSSSERKQVRYTYAYRLSAQSQDYYGKEESAREEIQLFVNNSLGLMTGGCELCAYGHYSGSPALFCEKKKTPVNWGSPRCEFFIRNPSQAQDIKP